MPTKQATGARGKADRLFRQIVRARGTCEARGWPLWPGEHSCAGNLETCHILSRRYAHTRCDPDNAVLMCSSAHRYFTDNPLDWAVFVEWWAGVTRRWITTGSDGAGTFGDELRRRRDQLGKIRWEDEVTRLQEILRGM